MFLLTTKSVQSTSLALQSIDNVHGSDGLALGVLRVSDSIADDVLEEDFKHAPSFFVDETGDSLDTTSAS